MELKPDKEVVNGHPKTLIVGYGWVGRHIHKYFTDANYVDIDNVIKGPEHNYQWDICFICVPTPEGESGRCDMSMVDAVVNRWKDYVKCFCCKSTIEIGTSLKYRDRGIDFCFSPEYLGETRGHVLVDYIPDPFVIVGGPKKVTIRLAEAWTLVTNSYAKIIQTDGTTAELVKLMENSFIATKVMFVNEFFEIAETLGIDFNELRELWLMDPRVGRSHTYCYRNNRGFGGKCLPKDLRNLTNFLKDETCTRARLIEFLLEYNKDMRKDYEI